MREIYVTGSYALCWCEDHRCLLQGMSACESMSMCMYMYVCVSVCECLYSLLFFDLVFIFSFYSLNFKTYLIYLFTLFYPSTDSPVLEKACLAISNIVKHRKSL